MRRTVAAIALVLLFAACDRAEEPRPPAGTPSELPSRTSSPAPEPTAAPVWSRGDPAAVTDETRTFVVEVATGAVLEVNGVILGWSAGGEVLVGARIPGVPWRGVPGGKMLEAWDQTGFEREHADGPYVDDRVAYALGNTGDLAYIAGEPNPSPPGPQLPPFELRVRTSTGDDFLLKTFDDRGFDLPIPSPDGRLIAMQYYGGPLDGRGILVFDVQRRRPTMRVTGAAIGEWASATQLTYTANVCGGLPPIVVDGTPEPSVPPPDIDLLDASSGTVTHLAATDAVEQHGVLSPNRTRIAYLARTLAADPAGSAIVVVDVNTGASMTLVHGGSLTFAEAYGGPATVWSADGRYIAFAAAGRGAYMHGLCHDYWPVPTSVELLP